MVRHFEVNGWYVDERCQRVLRAKTTLFSSPDLVEKQETFPLSISNYSHYTTATVDETWHLVVLHLHCRLRYRRKPKQVREAGSASCLIQACRAFPRVVLRWFLFGILIFTMVYNNHNIVNINTLASKINSLYTYLLQGKKEVGNWATQMPADNTAPFFDCLPLIIIFIHSLGSCLLIAITSTVNLAPVFHWTAPFSSEPTALRFDSMVSQNICCTHNHKQPKHTDNKEASANKLKLDLKTVNTVFK